jgi:hypothetical protein
MVGRRFGSRCELVAYVVWRLKSSYTMSTACLHAPPQVCLLLYTESARGACHLVRRAWFILVVSRCGVCVFSFIVGCLEECCYDAWCCWGVKPIMCVTQYHASRTAVLLTIVRINSIYMHHVAMLQANTMSASVPRSLIHHHLSPPPPTTTTTRQIQCQPGKRNRIQDELGSVRHLDAVRWSLPAVCR